MSALVRVLRWSSVARSRLRPASLPGGRPPVKPCRPSARRLARQGRLEPLRVAEKGAQSLRSKSRIAADARRQSFRPLKLRRLASARPRPYMDQALSEECGDARGGATRQSPRSDRDERPREEEAQRAARGGGATARRGDRRIVPGERSVGHDADLGRGAATVTRQARGASKSARRGRSTVERRRGNASASSGS